MQEQVLHAHAAAPETGRRPGQQFASVDLRRPKGYAVAAAAAPTSQSPAAAAATAGPAAEGEPCPRCESRDTKFCYYNNYNTSQPRHFCKCCRRYWTKGGTLRNVPVGGGTRKKSSSSSSSSSSSPSSASSPAAVAKRQKPSKKRRVAAPEPATSADAVTAPAPDSNKTTETTAATATTTTTTTTPTTDAASEITTELVVPAVEEDSFTDLLQQGDDGGVALELGFSDNYPAGGGKALVDPYSFEWPPAFDLGGAYWGGAAGFTDPDPAAFMNLP